MGDKPIQNDVLCWGSSENWSVGGELGAKALSMGSWFLPWVPIRVPRAAHLACPGGTKRLRLPSFMNSQAGILETALIKVG